MADIVRNVMKETGISVTDLLAAAIEVAHQEYPSELVKHRDDIIQGLYSGVQCIECANMGREHVHSTGALISEVESQNSPMDLGKANFSDQPEMVVKKNSHQEQSPERPRLRVVIRLKKNKNMSVDATERPKSEETKPVEAATSNKCKTDEFQNDDISGMEFENAKRKLHESYKLAANAKKQRCLKMVATHELPTQKLGNCMQKKNQLSSSAKARIASKLKKMKMHRR